MATENNIRKVTCSSEILKNKSIDRDCNFLVVLSFSKALKSYWEKRRDESWMLATIRYDTRNVLNMQHIIPN